MRDDLKKHGAFSWFELMTTDVAAARDFYTKVFQWEWEKYPMEGEDYWVMKVGGEDVGGLMKKPVQAGDAPNYWATYVTVEDVDATARAAQEHGGTLLVPPTDVPNVGRFCVIMDPQGAVISAITYVPDAD